MVKYRKNLSEGIGKSLITIKDTEFGGFTNYNKVFSDDKFHKGINLVSYNFLNQINKILKENEIYKNELERNFQMLRMFYNKYKIAFWFVLAILFATGSISNIYTGAILEVALNAFLGIICLIVSIGLLFKKRKNENE